MKLLTSLVLVLLIASSAFAFEQKAFTMRDDFGTEPLWDCYMRYYYYIPNLGGTGSWFWYFTGWTVGDIVGEFFQVGDMSTDTGVACDPTTCFTLERIRILDFAGYGTIYPGWFSATLDVYCSDDQGCPVGPSIYTSPPWDTGFGWNYWDLDPFLCLDECAIDQGPPLSGPRVLVTATHTGSLGLYPAWGADCVSTPFQEGAQMHDYSCLAAIYPRPYNSYYTTIHSGYYGNTTMYCPPGWFLDGDDTTQDGSMFGYIELCWTLYLGCVGPTATEPSTWGNIKSMYR